MPVETGLAPSRAADDLRSSKNGKGAASAVPLETLFHAGFTPGGPSITPYSFTARSVISSPLSIIANASRSCASLMHSGGLVKKVFQRTNVRSEEHTSELQSLR